MPFKKGQSGNPAGRGKGKRANLTAEIHEAVAADAMPIVRSVIASAKAGDIEARRAFLKLLPQGRWPVTFVKPTIKGPADIAPAIDAVLDAAAKGELSLDDAEKIIEVVNMMRLAYETTSLADQVEAMRLELEGLKANSS